jgi:2-dehydropantoate 2-reductase
MNVLVYGAGVVGSQYAAGLRRAGHEVSILARGKRLADLEQHGIVLESMASGRRTVTWVKTVESLAPDEIYDLVLVPMRRNQVPAVLPVLAANRHTPSVLFLGNNVAGPDEYVAALGRERVLLGFGGVGGVREGHVVRRFGDDSGRSGATYLGELDGRTTPRVAYLTEAFAATPFPVTVVSDIDAWLKMHAAVVLPLAAAIYLAGGDNYRLARTRDGLVLAARAIGDGLRALRALDIPIVPSKYRALAWVPEPLVVALLRRIMDTEFAEIGLAGHANAAQDEMSALATEFRTLVDRASIPTPALDRLFAFFDPAVQPLPAGSAQMAMDWRGVWLALAAAGAVAATGALAAAAIWLARRRNQVSS